MTVSKFKNGDRVRIISGAWASDCGTVTSVTKSTVRVRTDTRRLVVITRHHDLQLIKSNRKERKR